MLEFSDLYLQNHRNQQLMLIGGTAVALICSLAPRNERALFVIGDRPAPVAFAAIAAPPPAYVGGPQQIQRVDRGLARPFRTSSRPPPGLPRASLDGVPFTPTAATPADGTPDAGVFPGQLASLIPSDSAIAGRPGGAGPPSFIPTTAPPGGSGPTTPGDTSTPVPPSTPATPVPEPMTWAMMVLGFFGLGVALRRKRSALSSDRVGLRQS